MTDLKRLIGLALGLALSWLAGLAAPTDPYALPGAALLVPLCAPLAVWSWSIIDAWRTASRSGPQFASGSASRGTSA